MIGASREGTPYMTHISVGAHTVRPYKAAGRSPPHPALRATFP